MTVIISIGLMLFLLVACLLVRKPAMRIASLIVLAACSFYIVFVGSRGLRQIVFEKLQQHGVTTDFASGVGYCDNYVFPYLAQLAILVFGMMLIGVISNLRKSG